MGNIISIPGKKEKTLSHIIDYVAANYIITSNFQDLTKLSDMTYCNKLVVLTSKVLQNNMSALEVQHLTQRLKGNVEVNKMKRSTLHYVDKDNFPSLDVRNQTQKRRMCLGIARYYVKIAHVFAAILTTINPTFTWKDSDGQEVSVGLNEKHKIPEGSQTTMRKINLCNERINALMQKHNNSRDDPKSKKVKLTPGFCKMNGESTEKSRTLVDEPGIPELAELYNDDYDFDHGGFIGMTDKMRKRVYEKDVRHFYKVFTGQTKVPSHIKTFSQIPLREYHRHRDCEEDGKFNKSYFIDKKSSLFKAYAKHVQIMMTKTEKKQAELINIIDKLFVFTLNPSTDKKEIAINPKLNLANLDKVIADTRKIIIDLYVNCENDFLKGLEIFEAIVQAQIKSTSITRITNLEEAIDKMASHPNDDMGRVNDLENEEVTDY